jgi:DinB family protein
MSPDRIIEELAKNKVIFKELLTGLGKEEYLWRQDPKKWCALEIICHLYDEEREDFRARTKHVLKNPELGLKPFDQLAWIEDRKYIEQNYTETLSKFLKEREQSVVWLKSLKTPDWNRAINHPKFGEMSAKTFLVNWLAHDYLHIKQILKLKFDYLQIKTGKSLDYAGNW